MQYENPHPYKNPKTEQDALAELRMNIKKNNAYGYRDDYDTIILFQGGKAFLSDCKNYIRVKRPTGSSNYMLKRKANKVNEATEDRRLDIIREMNQLKEQTVAELKSLCALLGLSKSGKKADLIARLVEVKDSEGEEE